ALTHGTSFCAGVARSPSARGVPRGPPVRRMRLTLSFPKRLFTARHPAPLLRNCDREIGALRSAENTVGHAAEFPRRGPHALPHRAGTFAGNVTEYSTEGAQARPACLEGDLGDRQIGVTEQRGRTLDTSREQVPVRWNTEGFLERSSEMGSGDVAHPRQPPHGPGLMRGRVHPILRAQQTPQKLGILACGTFTHAAGGRFAG